MAVGRFDRLCLLVRRRWSIPILAALHRDEGGHGGAKFVTLCHRVGAPGRPANQGAVRQSIEHLIEAGWLARNPGYGHPLRPEYILTRSGAGVASAAAALDAALRAAAAQEIMLRRWSLPIVRAAHQLGESRFTQLAECLQPVTDRALSLALRDLGQIDAIARIATPAPAYVVTPEYREVAELAARV